MDSIYKILKKYFQKKTINELIIQSGYLFFVSIVLLLIVVSFEKIFFIEQSLRLKIVYFFFPILSFLFLYILMQFIIKYFSLLNSNNKYQIAAEFGDEFSSVKDQLLNTLQIQDQKNTANRDLKKYASKYILKKLNKISKVPFIAPKGLIKLLVCAVFILGIITINKSFNDAMFRLINYNETFDPPLPFTLKSISGNINTMSSDTLEINILGKGEIPDSINFHWIENDIENIKKIAKQKEEFNFIFENIKSDIIYWGEYNSTRFFSPWDKISTEKKYIEVKQRPNIEDIIFTIIPPNYTNMNESKYILSNNNQMDVLIGSILRIEATSDKNLDSAWMLNDNNRKILDILDNEIYGELEIISDMSFSIHILDENFIPNSNPRQYSINLEYDLAPNISIQSPQTIFEIDESMIIPISANINDDFGLLDIYLEYEIISQDFPEFSKNSQKIIISKELNQSKSININMNWDISKIPISMGDELHIRLIAKDNKISESNQQTTSNTLIGKFPTLDDLFSEIEELEGETEDIVDDIESTLENISDLTEEVKMELLKSDKPSWEQEKKLEQTFEEMSEISSQIEQMQENIDKILDKAEKNQLFSNELLSKFEKFQELLDTIMSNELFQAMQELQESLQNLDMNQITEALDNYNFNIEQFEEQIDRYIDMFQTAMAEQKLDELAENIENMIEKQNDLISDLDNNEDEYVLSKKSKKQESRYDNFKESVDETKNSMKSINENTYQDLQDLIDDSIIKETEYNLKKQTESIKRTNSNQMAKSAKSNLEGIAEMIEQVRAEFQEEITKKLTKEFILIIDNLLSISNQQEQLIDDSKSMRSNSPNLKEINRFQDNIDRQLNQITKQLIDLSNNTFFVNPNINRYIGKLKSSISNTISSFEQKQISEGKKNQVTSLKYINNITFLLLLSMDEMQSSNSASGFEKFMESLQDMSNKQEGINQGTMQLGQFGMMQQNSMMQQLMEQQRQLQEQLNELISDNPGEQTGGLSKAAEDMEDVILDFNNNNINRETYDRQQKILSRMLDNQKSLTEKDYSKKRKSETSSDYILSSSSNIPDDYGEKDLYYIKAMESAFQKGVSKEYDKITRIYFLNLQKDLMNETYK
jgi:hypothetical protein